MITVIDNFLPADEYQAVMSELQQPISTHRVDRIVENTAYDGLYANSVAEVMFFDSQILHDIFQSKVSGTIDRHFQRLRTTHRSDSIAPNPPHQDLKKPHTVCLWYPLDSDGDLIVYQEVEDSDRFTVMKTIEPKNNRFICFDGRHFHSGNTPKKYARRSVLNLHCLKD